MPPRKIFHLITSLDRGGAQTMLTHVVTRLDPLRFEPIVVSLMASGPVAAKLRADGICVVDLDMRRGIPSFGAFLRLKALIRRERPALMVSWLYHADLLTILAAGSVPVAWNVRLSSLEGDAKTRRIRILQRILAFLSRRPAVIVINSNAGKDRHAALGYRPARWEVIANGFDLETFQPDALRRSEARREMGVRDGDTVIGMVARVDGMKDHATFLDAAALIAAKRSEVRFILIGAGTENLAMPTALAGIATALGERGDVARLLPGLDLMVLASLGEGFPNAVGEAMACAVPCVASDVGDVKEIIGDTGAVVPPQDTPALASAVAVLLARGPAELTRLGALARERIRARYSIDATVRRYEQMFESISAMP
jgi:glycosyltransferase involved in cell wall biosynthesis